MAILDKVQIFKTALLVIEKVVTVLINCVDYVLKAKEL